MTMQRARLNSPNGYCDRIAVSLGFLASAMLVLVAAEPVSAATLDRVKETGKLTIGYRTDARPFSYQNESGAADGYAVALCKEVAEQLKAEQGLQTLNVEWVSVSAEDQFQAVREGKVDLLCGAAETLTSRKDADFSVPIFAGGIGTLIRADAPIGLKEVLSGRPPSGPLWRGYPAQLLTQQVFSVVAGTPSEKWLTDKLDEFQLTAKVVPVKSYEEGVRGVLDGNSNVFFADRSILLDTVARNESAANLTVLNRRFNYAPIALAMERGDPDFRLMVDRILSKFLGSEAFHNLYAKWFGKPGQNADAFFRLSVLPE
jgi:ABC-type amino acid transport substrate-binding protein